MGVTSTSKQVNLERIDCDGTLQVTLALSASPDIVSNPTDIVLTLDRSDSLEGAPDAIGSGSRIGIVSFNQRRHRRHAADHLRCGAQRRGRRARCLRLDQPRGRLFRGDAAL